MPPANTFATAAFATATISTIALRMHKLSQSETTPLLKFTVSDEMLRRLKSAFLVEMQAGLDGVKGCTMKMLPSYVDKLPTGGESGTFWALDLGGTNFRVVRVPLSEASGCYGEMSDHKVSLSQQALTGSADDLFGFIAHEIKKEGARTGDLLSFTFSFPVNQTSINTGTLMEWTKGFSTVGVVGKDVVELLSAALHREGIDVSVVAMVNDTVGTLMSCAYERADCRIGAILGTGSNACYVERIDKIGKLKNINTDSKYMVINMEWGGFGSAPLSSPTRAVLPLTAIDDEIDSVSPNKGRQRFEKLISGLYIGEMVRLLLRDLAHSGMFSSSFSKSWQKNEFLFWEKKATISNSNMAFQTKEAARIERDVSPELADVKVVLEQHGIDCTTALISDFQLIQDACSAISTRSARLAAIGIAAIIEKMKNSGVEMNSDTDGRGLCSVGIDGSVFEKYPKFKSRMEAALDAVGCKCSLVLAQDGSGKGAALVAACL